MATVYSPTEYGPVEVYTSPGTTSIDSQTQGTIAKLVALPNNDAYPQVDSTGKWTYVEKYVGPTSVVKDLPKTAFFPGNPRTTARNTVGASMFVDRFSAPDLPTGYIWVVESCTVRQNTAGDKSDISIHYRGSNLQYQPGSGWYDNIDDNTWSLQWQPYSLTPYAFCKNEMKADRPAKDPKVASDTANRSNIEKFFDSKVDISAGTYIGDDNVTLRLNDAELLISRKILESTNCQWHYPIITHNTSKSASLNALSVTYPPIYPGEVGGVDFTFSEVIGMPFSFDVNYKWVKIDDSVNGYKDGMTFTYKRSEKFMGVISADINYYGNTPFDHNNLSGCRWEAGRL